MRRLVQGVGVGVGVLHLGVERRRLGGGDRGAVVLELVGDLGGVLVLALGQLELRASEVGVVDDVGDVEEGRLVQPDVHEGRLHAREHPDDAALVDVADDALVLLTLEIELRDVAVLDERHARLAAGRVDKRMLPMGKPRARASGLAVRRTGGGGIERFRKAREEGVPSWTQRRRPRAAWAVLGRRRAGVHESQDSLEVLWCCFPCGQ